MPLGIDELMTKAEMQLGDLRTNGGELAPAKRDEFIARATVATPLLSAVQVRDQESTIDILPKFQITGRVAHRATAGQALTLAQRTRPITDEVSIETTEFVAELPLNRSILEDNVMKERLVNLVEEQMPIRISRDIQQNAVSGDTGSATFDLAAFDGLRQLVVTNTVAAGSVKLNLGHIASSRLALPEEFRGDYSALRLMMGDSPETRYRQDLAARVGAVGDQYLQGNDPITQLSIKFMTIPEWPITLAPGNLTDAVLLDPKNFIVSFWRKIEMDQEKNVRARKITLLWSYRVGMEYEEEEATVKINALLVS